MSDELKNEERRLSRTPYYILVDGKPKPMADVLEWARWRLGAARSEGIVEKTTVAGRLVSTVFLGIDHGNLWNENEAPLLWETMIFPEAEFQERYTSLEDAKRGHEHVVMLVREGHTDESIYDIRSDYEAMRESGEDQRGGR